MLRYVSCVFILLYCICVYASPLSWQTFSGNNITWICSPEIIYVFSSDSRSVHPLVLDQTRTVGKISNVIEHEGILFISTDAGIYQLDMSTQSIERITFSDDKNRAGKIASDMDYLWLSTDDTLYRFDKLSREWQAFPEPDKSAKIAILSDGTTVECLSQNSTYTFTITTEKWNRYRAAVASPDSSSVKSTASSVVQVCGNTIYTYTQNALNWEVTTAKQPVSDFSFESGTVYYSCGNKVYSLSSGVSKPIDILNESEIFTICKKDQSIYIALKDRIINYNTNNSEYTYIDYPEESVKEIPSKLVFSTYLISLNHKSINLYDFDRKTWTVTKQKSHSSTSKISWTDQGPMIEYKPGYYTNVKGYIESKTSLKSDGFVYDSSVQKDSRGKIVRDSLNNPVYVTDSTDSTLLLKWSKPDFTGDFNIHTTDPDGRSLDVTFDNSNALVPAKKIIQYKGLKSDILQTLRGGTCETDIMQSKLSTPVTYEGGQITVETKSNVKGRDRKIAKLGGGGGFITSRSEWRVLKYNADGIYSLKKVSSDTSSLTSRDSASTLTNDTALSSAKVKDTTQLVPGSVSVWVDGSELDPQYFTFYATTRTLKINSDAPVDPGSMISVSYKVQPIPEGGNDEIEFKPEYHFGKDYYGTGTITPFSWISARAGFETIDKDTSNTIFNAALPIELRKENPDLLLKFTPEYSYDIQNKSHAGAIDMQSRIGPRLGITFDGLVADTDFTTADTLTRGFGRTKNEYNLGLSYNILPELPVEYKQHRYVGLYGTESNYTAGAGAHFQNFPYFDINISRTTLDDNESDTNDVFDSLFQTKDRMTFKLYETASPLLAKLLHIYRVRYDITHAEYRYQEFDSDTFNYGRSTNARLTINPIQPVNLICNTTYKHGDLGNHLSSSISPSIKLLTFEFPRGIDFTGEYSCDMSKYSDLDSSNVTLSRKLGLILRPGRWYNKFGWFTLNGSIKDDIKSSPNTSNPSNSLFFETDDSKISSTRLEELGTDISINETFIVNNINSWTSNDSSNSFSSSNRVQVLFNSRNQLDNRLNYSSDDKYYKVSGLSQYILQLKPWLQLTPAIEGNNEEDSTGHKTSIAPQLTTKFSFDDWLFLKTFMNSHQISLNWDRQKAKTSTHPDVSYIFTLNFTIKPNIKLSNQEIVSFSNGNFDKFSGNLICTILF